MFYIRLKKKNYWKNERIAHFHWFPLFWWAMWVNRSFCSNQMSDSLRSLRGNERSWVNHSGRSPKMSKWMNHSFFWANRSFAHFWTKNKRFARKSNEWISSPAKWVPNTISLSAGNGEWFDVFLFLLFPTVYKRCSCVPFPVVPNSESLNTLNALGAHLW